MKLWLDARLTPPDGWHHARSIEEAVALLMTNQVTHLSVGEYNMWPLSALHVLDWLEAQVRRVAVRTPELAVHTDHVARRERLLLATRTIMREHEDNESLHRDIEGDPEFWEHMAERRSSGELVSHHVTRELLGIPPHPKRLPRAHAWFHGLEVRDEHDHGADLEWLGAAISEAFEDIDQSYACWALVGGYAFAAHGVPWFGPTVEVIVDEDPRDVAGRLVGDFGWTPLLRDARGALGEAPAVTLDLTPDPLLRGLDEQRQQVMVRSRGRIVVALNGAQHPVERETLGLPPYPEDGPEIDHWSLCHVSVGLPRLGALLAMAITRRGRRDLGLVDLCAEVLPPGHLVNAVEWVRSRDAALAEKLVAVLTHRDDV